MEIGVKRSQVNSLFALWVWGGGAANCREYQVKLSQGRARVRPICGERESPDHCYRKAKQKIHLFVPQCCFVLLLCINEINKTEYYKQLARTVINHMSVQKYTSRARLCVWQPQGLDPLLYCSRNL